MGYLWHNNGFLHDSVHENIPQEAIAITGDEHASLMLAQANGCQIITGPDGRPVAVSPPEPEFNPGPDYQKIDGAWVKTRFSKKDFLLLCGIPLVTALNTAINAGNALAKTVHDLLFASEYIDLTDPATIQMLQLLTTAEAGGVLTEAQAQTILKGVIYEEEA